MHSLFHRLITHYYSRQEVEALFKSLDLDASGTLSAQEILSALGGAEGIDVMQVQHFIDQCDANADQQLSLDELINFLCQ